MSNYKYELGQVVNGLEITGITKKKINAIKRGKSKEIYTNAYTYKCLKCGYSCGEYYRNGKHFDSYSIAEHGIDVGNGCFICSKNGAVAPDINSIKATAPELVKYIVNDVDALQYTDHSWITIDCKCPDCGKQYRRKVFKIAEFGVPCSCGDCFSYPEKFMFSVLEQLGLNFEQQYIIDGSNFRYDFYVKDINTIIEVNGIQHYEVKWKSRNEPENDTKKKEFAYSHGFYDSTYIVLDCHESSCEFIKQSILNSKLAEYFDFSKVDFEKCSEFAISNLAKIACEYWNTGMNVQDIADEMKINKHTVMKYLRQGNDAKWCKYCPGDGVARYSKVRSVKGLNASGVTGVTWHKGSSTWCSRITVDKKRIPLGFRKNLQDAIRARLEAEIKYFGYDDAPQKHLFDQYGIVKN
jgi:transposase-like protein